MSASSATVAAVTPTLITTIESDATGATAAFLNWWSQLLPEAASDEATIFANALLLLDAKIKAGVGWEEALSAVFNEFYSEEITEAKKLVMQALETFAKITSGFATAIAAVA